MPTLLLALLAGCGLLPSPGGGPDGIDTAADTADTGPVDTDPDGPGTPLDGGPCPAFFGAGDEGDWRRSETLPHYEEETSSSGTWTITTTAVDGDAVTRTTESTWDSEASGTTTATSTSVYRCDDTGAWLVSTSTRSEFTAQGEPAWSDYEATFDPPYLVMPADAGPGVEWTATVHYTWTTTSSQAPATSGEATYTLATRFADGTSTATTPAGTFEAVEVTAHTTVDSTTTTSTWLAHEELGVVRSEASALVAHGP